MKKGRHHSEGTKKKMSLAAKSRKHRPCSEETKKKIGDANRGRKFPLHSGEWRRKNSLGHIGKHHSEETKQKIGLANKGRKHPHTEEAKKKISKARIGTHHTEKSKQKMSNAKKGLKNPWLSELNRLKKGERHPCWLGGISKLPYAFDFDTELKKLIKKRDKYTCQLCQKRKISKNLCVHHADYNKQNSSPDNLVSLCWNCHGKTGSHRKTWTEFFNRKLKFA